MSVETLSWEQIDLAPTITPEIHIKMILDRSGSMRNDWSKTIDGVVEYFSGLKAQGNTDYKVSLHAFAHNSKAVFEEITLDKVEEQKIRDLVADGISTSLYDTVGEIISKINNEAQPYLIVIFTDGQDNSSRNYNSQKLKALIGKLEDQGNFTFVFMGASADSWGEADLIAISQGNRSLFNRSNISESFNGLRASTMSYSAERRAPNATLSTRNFYSNTVPTSQDDTSMASTTNDPNLPNLSIDDQV